MQPRGSLTPRTKRLLMAAVFAVTSTSSEALKIVAGFDQHPDGSQLLATAMVLALSAALGWVTAPAFGAGDDPDLKKMPDQLDGT
jgi:hypothetical protein